MIDVWLKPSFLLVVALCALACSRRPYDAALTWPQMESCLNVDDQRNGSTLTVGAGHIRSLGLTSGALDSHKRPNAFRLPRSQRDIPRPLVSARLNSSITHEPR